MEPLYNNLDLLEELFLNLPETLPNSPPTSNLNFELDPVVIEEEGWGVEFNRRMEIAWQSWKGPIQVQERGARLKSCISLLREGLFKLNDCERELWVGGWTEKLKCAALAAGAQLSRACEVIEILSDSEYDTSDLESSNKSPCSRGLSVEVAILGSSCGTKPKLRQSKLQFSKVDRETYLEQCAQQALRMQATTKAFEAAEAIQKEEHEKKKRLKDMLRKRVERDRIQQKEIESGRRDKDGKVIRRKDISLKKDAPSSSEVDAAKTKLDTVSRSRKQIQRQQTHAEPLEPLRRICWQHPARWIHIVAAVKAEGGMEFARRHPSSITHRLRLTHRDSGMFEGLHKGVLRRWFTVNSNGESCWTEAVLKAVERESHAGGHGQSKKLAKYPAVLAGFTMQVRALRGTNVPITTPVARSILMAHLRVHAPEIANNPFSDRWFHIFLHDQLGFLYRAATKSARKQPADWEDQCLLTFLRISRTVMQYNIKTPRLIINADQTGILLFPVGNKTWDMRGSKQVKSLCHDEKRQYTLVVASSCGGDILPFQSVWGGSTSASLPSTKATRHKEATDLGFKFAHGDTRHWSSLGTTKEWVEEILVPYLKRVRQEEGLPANSKAILYIDCWPVHISKSTADSFLPWMAKHHPDVEVLFVPAGCTGEFQPADTMLQRIIKHIIKKASLDFFVAWGTRMLKNGVAPERVVLPSDLPTLRNASVAWTLEAYHYLARRPEIVRKSWEMCRTKEWDLSWSKLTSPETAQLFFATAASNPKFMKEVSIAEPFIPGPTSESLSKELDKMDASYSDELGDDLTLSPDEVVQALTKGATGNVTTDTTGVLQRVGDEEDIEVVHSSVPADSKNSLQDCVQVEALSNFLTDIAVLGGTNAAALEDLSANRKNERPATKSATRSKKRKQEGEMRNDDKGKDEPTPDEPESATVRQMKRSRRSVHSSSS